MIIARLIYESNSFLACSILTCYSWYLTSMPRFRHTLITATYDFSTDGKFIWPKPLRDVDKFGSLSLIKMLHVRGPCYCVENSGFLR